MNACVCVRACVRACVCACVRVCVSHLVANPINVISGDARLDDGTACIQHFTTKLTISKHACEMPNRRREKEQTENGGEKTRAGCATAYLAHVLHLLDLFLVQASQLALVCKLRKGTACTKQINTHGEQGKTSKKVSFSGQAPQADRHRHTDTHRPCGSSA